MKHILLAFAFFTGYALHAQFNSHIPTHLQEELNIVFANPEMEKKKEIQQFRKRWHISKNHLITGTLVFTAGIAKGFNETLQFNWNEFQSRFPKNNARWFNPAISWQNKYKNNNPDEGPKFPLSTTALVMFTDQYHLNNFIMKTSWATALVFKIGEGKKPLKYYLLDTLYYLICYQAGFAVTYYPFIMDKK